MNIEGKVILPENISNIMSHLIANGFQAYVVGGAVRDYFLRKEPHDYDIFTNATGDMLKELFPNSKVLGGEERQAKILTVLVNGVEVSQYRCSGDRTATKVSTTLEQHLGTCDYNVNAMACDINGQIIDLYNGESDLKHKHFRFVGNGLNRIKEDPLRMMRGMRLILQHDLNPTLESKTKIKEKGKLLQTLAQERIRDELLKIIGYEKCLDKLVEYNLLQHILPELYNLIGLDAGPHHNEDDCFMHSNLAFKNAVKLTQNKLLLFSVALHDIGKKTSAKVIDGAITFHHHEVDGVKLAKVLMKRMSFSTKEINYVGCIIRHHMMGPVKKLRDVTFAKIGDDLNKAKVAPEDMVIMTYSDNQANLTKVRLSFHKFLKENPFLRKYYEFTYSQKPFNKNDLDIDGKALINMGIKPGPEIGRILNFLFELVHSGKTRNRRDILLKYVKTVFIKKVKKDVKHTK